MLFLPNQIVILCTYIQTWSKSVSHYRIPVNRSVVLLKRNSLRISCISIDHQHHQSKRVISRRNNKWICVEPFRLLPKFCSVVPSMTRVHFKDKIYGPSKAMKSNLGVNLKCHILFSKTQCQFTKRPASFCC